MRRRWKLVTAATVAALLASTSAASAAWTDTATLDTASIGAHQVVSQEQPACETYGGILGLLTGARITWSHVDARYEYSWVARRADNSAVVASGVVTPPVTAAAGSTVTVEMNTNLLDLGLGARNLNIVVTSRLRGHASWAAASSTSTPVSTTAVVLGLNVRCR